MRYNDMEHLTLEGLPKLSSTGGIQITLYPPEENKNPTAHVREPEEVRVSVAGSKPVSSMTYITYVYTLKRDKWRKGL